ncbi:MAG TPA: glycosyltransferase family 9 protein [Burkholderiaceae bacterium]|nr:glycosyltransferase family 9 protein [Burkholderiaceae bacterium]
MSEVDASAGCHGIHRSEVRRIGVFRALMLGDLLCAVPAWRALKKAYPHALLTLIGLPWARTLAQRLACVDEFVAFPGHPCLPDTAPDLSAWPGFLADVQARRFDLLLQLHGSGAQTNAVLALFGARRLVCFHPADQPAPSYAHTSVPWPDAGHETERLLRLCAAIGVPADGFELEFPVRREDRRALHALWPGGTAPAAYAVVHPGAQLPSRRWPAERFARVADMLAGQGLAVVLTGTAGERGLACQVRAAMRSPAIDLAGRTGLWEMGALLEGARLLVSNDTGVTHVAAALGTPTIVVSSGGEVRRWQRLDDSRRRVLWRQMPCRPCAHARCPIGHPCALAIGVDEVTAAAGEMLQATRSLRADAPSLP